MHLSRDNPFSLIHFIYSLNQVHLSAEAGEGRQRYWLSRTNSTNIRRRRRRKKSCLSVVRLCVFSYKGNGNWCLCARLTVQNHKFMRQCYREPAVLQQKAGRICGGEIRTERLHRGPALPAQRQTKVRQTSFDVSTE